jgi:hypothetical protein
MSTIGMQHLMAMKSSMGYHNRQKSKPYRLVIKCIGMLERGESLNEKICSDVIRLVSNDCAGMHMNFVARVLPSKVTA